MTEEKKNKKTKNNIEQEIEDKCLKIMERFELLLVKKDKKAA